jgi:hypothetical protein
MKNNTYPLTPKSLWCADCGKQFVHYVGGIAQTVCSYCAGADREVSE